MALPRARWLITESLARDLGTEAAAFDTRGDT